VKRYPFSGIFLFFVFVLTTVTQAQLVFEPQEYASRRDKLMDQMGDGIAVLQGAQLPTGSYPFYQTNDFLYLSGVEVPNAGDARI